MTALDPSYDLGPPVSGNRHDLDAGSVDPRDRDRRDMAMLAHDIRGALQGVLGGILQIEGGDLEPSVREQVERVAAAARALVCLVGTALGDPLDPAAVDAHSRVELRRFLRLLTRRWTGEARAKRIGFSIGAPEDLPFGLRVHLVLIDRLMGNLIGNAIRYSARGAVRLDLRRPPEGGVEFRVTDDGPGFPEDVLVRIQRRGIHPTEGATRSGRGLGLHIVKSLCEQMGGTLSLANPAGGGAEAIVRFPAALCIAVGPAPEPHDRPATAVDRPALDGLRVLLAEDNPTNQMVATQMLESLGAAVTVSSDGVEAMACFEATEFDLVVVDIEMPRMSGLDVIRAIRGRRDGRAGLPIVALTAYAMREHRERIAQAGANGLISKPITSIEAFGRALRGYLVPGAPRPIAVAEALPAPMADPATGPASGPATDPAVIDQAVYDALCEAIGPEMMAELLEKVEADFLSARADLAAAISPIGRDPIRSASHILISVAGAIGANTLQASARALNAAAQSAADAALADSVRGCLGDIDLAVGFVRVRRAAG